MTTTKVFGGAVALAVIALVLAVMGGGDSLASQAAYVAGAGAVVLFVLGLVQMTSAKKP